MGAVTNVSALESMQDYHKIDSVFLRDPANRMKTFLMGQWTRKEFGYLQNLNWIWEEKLDGTNVRVRFNPPSGCLIPGEIVYGGRDKDSQMPTHLYHALHQSFSVDKFLRAFEVARDKETGDWPEVTLYGEGCGEKIQKGGHGYGKTGFILFDVTVGQTTEIPHPELTATTKHTKRIWLERANVRSVAEKMGIRVAPVVGQGTLNEAIEFVKSGPISSYGDFQMEGIVARLEHDLFDRMGKRLITKIKYRDFGSKPRLANWMPEGK